MATGAPDSNGVWQYGDDDPRSPFKDLLNLLASSVSTAIGSLKSRATSLENANTLSAVGSPCAASSGWSIATNNGRKKNGVAWIYITITRTGSAITVPADGNIVNEDVASFNAGWAPASGMGYPVTGGSSGPVISGTATSSVLQLTAVSAGVSIPTGFSCNLVATYPLT